MDEVHPIFKAILEADNAGVQHWLQKDPVCVNKQNKHGETPLLFAIENHKHSLAKLLFSHPHVDLTICDDISWNALHHAASAHNLEMCQLLVEKGIDMNAKDYEGTTPLILVSEHSETDVLCFLIQKGAEIDHVDDNNDSLYRDIEEGICGLSIEFILEHGHFLKEETRKKFIGLRLKKLFS